MGDHRTVIQTYTEALVEALRETGVDWIDWRIAGNHLQLDLHPRDAFPFQLRVVPGGDGANCFVEGDLAGVFYMTANTTVELDKPVMREIRALCEVILERIDAEVVEAVRSHASDDWARLTQVDEVAMVRGGYMHAAVLSLPESPQALEQLLAEVPAMLPADDEFFARFQARNPSAEQGKMLRPIYIGADQQTVRRLSELDKILHFSQDAAARSSAMLEVALLFGTPKCCAKIYASHLANPSKEPDHVTFLRHVESWSSGDGITEGPPPRYPRLTNFLAARSHQIVFIDYWPCSPFCEETIYRNRRMLNDLYNEDDRRVVEEILGTSYVGWADGRLLPFRIEAVEGTELRVVDGRRAPWAGLALDRYRSFYCQRIPGGGRAADLRRLERRGRSWRWFDGSRWRRIAGDRTGWLRQRPPLVALFGDA
ncbi:MAG: hypothetical protein ABIK09_10150 [Pseudomonadota bacterium]